MSFDPFHIDLPVKEIIPDVLKVFRQTNTLMVSAPAGAGKSTLLPLAFLDENWLGNKKIIMLEPRRLAARSIAARMAFFLNETVGETVGYRIRFESRVSDKTKIEVLTEGILTRMLHSDNDLSDIAMIIFDEFHERSIHADVALALCRESQQILRPDLKLMIMSATLDIAELSNMLSCEVISSAGKLFPVDIIHVGDTDEYTIPQQAANVICKAVQTNEGDALVFLPGEGEIKQTKDLLESKLRGFIIVPLFGSLPIKKQYLALFPHKSGKRKIVLSTSIAETSLTIEGIKIVIDSGFGRTSRFDPKTGLSKLQTIRISKSSAAQRAGRAGRLGPGICYRMWTKATHEKMIAHTVPEIQEADLASLVLDLAKSNIRDIYSLTWLTPPPSGTKDQAMELLQGLEAIEQGKITALGERMLQLPCHPRIAHMLLKADESGMVALGADIAALLDERDPLGKEAGIDINLRIEALRRYREEQRSGGKLSRISKIARSYLQLFNASEDNDIVDAYETGILLTHAYPERIAHARPGNNAQFQLANGKLAMAGHRDDLAFEPWLAIAHMDARDGMGKIFLAAPLNPKDLASMVKKSEVISWDTRNGGLKASLDLRIGNIILQSKPLPEPDEKSRIKAICEAISKEGEYLLDFNQSVVQWQNRVLSLRRWRSQEDWPDVTTANLLANNFQWLSPYLSTVKKPEHLKKINLLEVLHFHLPHKQQQVMEILAPTKIPVPSGSHISVEYQSDGSPPVLAVRIQELFGMMATPTVNEGQNPVLIHLLSPGFKPVQITSDLHSFWTEGYFEVRKELKRRYPKHSWPDDPLNEPAISGVRRK